MGSSQDDRCVEIHGPHAIFKHIVKHSRPKKGIACSTCSEPHPKQIYECEECDQMWCGECWAQTCEQVRLHLHPVLIETNAHSS
jgi:hypothetical protein